MASLKICVAPSFYFLEIRDWNWFRLLFCFYAIAVLFLLDLDG